MEKIYQIAFLLIMAAFWAVSCTEPNHYPNFSTAGDIGEGSIKGMVRVKASGKETAIGTNVTSAKTLERPQMDVGFTYDFEIGRHEVICKDFNNVMLGETGLTVNCSQDSLPASNVTFYDAVLFANAMSKKYGVDTAYSYSNKEIDSERKPALCTNMAIVALFSAVTSASVEKISRPFFDKLMKKYT